MFDRKYFEEVVTDQIRLMERPVRLTLQVGIEQVYEVHSLVAAHETYVVLKVYGEEKAPEHSVPWREANPAEEAVIFDQVCIPYSEIRIAHLTARATKGDDARVVIGFRPKA